MEYTLKKPLQVYSKEKGEYEIQDTIIVSFTGKKGLQVIRRLQDEIFKIFAEQGKNRNITAEQKEKSDDKVVTTDELFDALEMTGQSAFLFQEVMGALKSFATIDGKKLDDTLQEDMTIEDLEGLYEEVIKSFLLPKITKRMNGTIK